MNAIQAFFAKLKNARFEQSQGAPGKSITVDTEGKGSNADNAEHLMMPGFHSIPVDAIQGLILNVGGQNVVVGTNNYGFTDDLNKGDTMLYSYDSDGVKKAYILCDSTGKIKVGNELLSLKTALDNIMTILSSHDGALGNLQPALIATTINIINGLLS